MQRNLYWPLNGPSFFSTSEIPSLCFFSLHERRRRLRAKFRGADGKPTTEPFQETRVKLTRPAVNLDGWTSNHSLSANRSANHRYGLNRGHDSSIRTPA